MCHRFEGDELDPSPLGGMPPLQHWSCNDRIHAQAGRMRLALDRWKKDPVREASNWTLGRLGLEKSKTPSWSQQTRTFAKCARFQLVFISVSFPHLLNPGLGASCRVDSQKDQRQITTFRGRFSTIPYPSSSSTFNPSQSNLLPFPKYFLFIVLSGVLMNPGRYWLAAFRIPSVSICR